MVLSGTPGQVAPLIPSGENGLFSREVFYYKSQIREWIDQFSVDEVDAEKEFHRMGYEWKATIDQLKCRGTITLRLDEQGNKPLSTTASYVFSCVPGNPTGRR